MGTSVKVTQIGMDVHRKFSTVTARDEQGRIAWRQRLEHTDRKRLRQEMSAWPKGTPVVLEGTFGWGWMSDELKEAGQDPHLASSRKVAGWRESRGMAKSNRTDADLLSELWSQPRVWKHGEPRHWWEVWLATQSVRDSREWLRFRMSLVKTQTEVKNRIHATLHRHGILHEKSDLFGKSGRALLKQLTDANDVTLRESGHETLSGFLEQLDQLRKQIAEVTRRIRQQVKEDEQSRRWDSLPGIGRILAYTIAAEIGDLGRFPNHRCLSRYALLAPMAQDSGDDLPDGAAPTGRHVGWAGRLTLKWAFIEAARVAVRKGGRFRELFDRRTNGGKQNRNRGYIAVAHEMCRVGFSCEKNKRDYTEQRPPRPGSVARERTSRPGTGQPDHPIAAVTSG